MVSILPLWLPIPETGLDARPRPRVYRETRVDPAEQIVPKLLRQSLGPVQERENQAPEELFDHVRVYRTDRQKLSLAGEAALGRKGVNGRRPPIPGNLAASLEENQPVA